MPLKHVARQKAKNIVCGTKLVKKTQQGASEGRPASRLRKRLLKDRDRPIVDASIFFVRLFLNLVIEARLEH